MDDGRDDAGRNRDGESGAAPTDGPSDASDVPDAGTAEPGDEEGDLPPDKVVVGWDTGVQWEESSAPSSAPGAWNAPPATPPGDFWVRPAAAAPLPPPRGRLGVLSVIGRTLDLFLHRPGPFLLLGLPGAVVSALSSLVYVVGAPASTGFGPGTAAALGSAAALGLLFGLIAVLVSIASGIAMTLAADDVRAGREVFVGQRFRAGIRRTGIAILSWILEYLAIILVVLGGIIVIALLAFTRSPALVAVGVAALIVVVAWIVLRWALSTTAIALEPVGPLEALSRSRAVTRGNVWRIFAVYLLFGLLVLPLGLGIGFLALALADVPVVTVGLSAAVSLVTVPLFAILSTTMFADLTGRPEAPIDATARGLRPWFAGGLVVLGILALAVAIPRAPAAFERITQAAIPAENRGVIVASIARNPFDPCQPIPVRGSLPGTVPIYVGGYFTRPIPAGGEGGVEMSVDGRTIDAFPIGGAGGQVACWAPPDPIDPIAGSWRIVVTSGSETIAQGTFEVR